MGHPVKRGHEAVAVLLAPNCPFLNSFLFHFPSVGAPTGAVVLCDNIREGCHVQDYLPTKGLGPLSSHLSPQSCGNVASGK